jgi:hypothetical protein
MDTDSNAPYFLVRSHPWPPGHRGPFSSILDATIAREIASPAWRASRILSKAEFEARNMASS